MLSLQNGQLFLFFCSIVFILLFDLEKPRPKMLAHVGASELLCRIFVKNTVKRHEHQVFLLLLIHVASLVRVKVVLVVLARASAFDDGRRG